MAESKMPALDGLTAIDRLRLFATDPETFSFDIDDAEAAVAKYDELAARADLVEPLVEALRRADQFITNGIELGFIRMPDPNCPDPAHQTPGLIRNALAAYTAAQSGQAQTEARG